jgi:hypothetical protein
MSHETDQLLKAQYETMRMQILSAYLAGDSRHFDTAYVQAWYHRMTALGLAHENEIAFDDAADIPTRYAGVTLAVVKQCALDGRYKHLAFRKLALEIGFVPEGRIRPILEFFILKNEFREDVIKALEVGLPDGPLKRSFDKSDIRFPS